MAIDPQVLKQLQIVLRHLAKDIRDGEVNPTKVVAYSKVLSNYAELEKMEKEEGSNNYYNRMEAEALEEIKNR